MRNHCEIKITSITAKAFHFYLSIFTLILFSTACYEDIEGCLDINANNFDVTADVECIDCCNFPTLELSVLHRISDPQLDTFYNLPLNDSITLDSINYFIINDLKFYLSDIQLVKSDGTAIGVTDEIQLINTSETDTISTFVEDNFALISRRSPRASSIGTIIANGDFSGIRFKVGLSETANTANPNLVPTNHPLFFDEGEMYFNADSGYVFNRIELLENTLLVDTTIVDTTLIEIGLNENLRNIVLDYPFSLSLGFNTSIILQIDYRDWFELIDFQNDSPSTIVTKIMENLPNSFDIAAIETSVN